MADRPSPKAYLAVFAGGALLALLGLMAFSYLSSTPTPQPVQGIAAEVVSDLPAVTVFKTPTCGCCAKWVEHLQASGFVVRVNDLPSLSDVKNRYGIPASMASCHTALVDGYVVEGHVPADDVKRLLTERPDITGIAVPGMPIGSPGMEQGDRKDPYNVLAFTTNGQSSIFASHP